MNCSRCKGNLPNGGEFATCLQCNKKLHYLCYLFDEKTWCNIEEIKKPFNCRFCRKTIEQSENINNFSSSDTAIDENTNMADTKIEQSMETKIAYLDIRLRILEQQLIKHDIEIINLPPSPNENLLYILKSIGKTIGLKVLKDDVLEIYRSINKDMSKSKVIITFRNLKFKKAFLNAVKLSRPLTFDKLNKNIAEKKDQYSSCGNVLIYERLTPFKKRLLWLAVRKAKEVYWKFAWDRDGHVYARRDEGEPAVEITEETDINKITN